MRFLLRTLGKCRLARDDGEPVSLAAGKPLALLVYLCVERRPVRRDELAGLLWPRSPRERGLQSVRQAVWLIRRELGDDAIAGNDPLEVPATVVGTDLERVAEAIGRGAVDEAAASWAGEFMATVSLSGVAAWADWVDAVREREAERLAAALHAASRGAAAVEARDRLERAIRLRPGEALYRVALAEALLELRDVDGAGRLLAELAVEDGTAVAAEVLGALEDRLARARRERERERAEGLEHPPFVGRTDELEMLARLWRGALDGRAASAILRGPAGIGRSRLVSEFARRVREEGRRVVFVRAAGSEQTLDLGFIALLARELLGLSGARGITGASDAVLRALLPSLGDAPAAASNGQPSPTAYADALLDLLGAVAWEAPTLVIVDDLHAADAASLAVLFRVLRQSRDEPLLFVVTAASHAPPAVERAMDEHCRIERTRCVSLRPLTRAETQRLVAQLIPDDAVAAADLADRLHRATAGGPGAIAWVLRELFVMGALCLEGEVCSLDARALPDPLPLPPAAADAAPGHRRRRYLAVAGVALAAALGAGTLTSMDSPPLWGGGEVYLRTSAGTVLLRPPARRGGEWTVRPSGLPAAAEPHLAHVRITTAGERRIYLNRFAHDVSPWITGIAPDGSEFTVAQGPTDINAPSLSPDGRRLAFIRDDPATDAYDIGLVVSEPDGRDGRVVLQMPGMLGFFGWDPAGDVLLVQRTGRPDSLITIDPEGRRLHVTSVSYLHSAAWCGRGRVLLNAIAGDGHALYVWTPSTGEMRSLPIEPLPSAVACSPDGSLALTFVADGAAVRLAAVDLETAALRYVLPGPVGPAALFWAARPDPVIASVTIEPRLDSLRWGERTTLGATVIGSDGRPREDDVHWLSLDPRIVSVTADGVISANRPGEARIVATAGVWRTDTLPLVVTGDVAGDDVVMRDPLVTLDTARWFRFGTPWPHAFDSPDGPVVALNGDGMNSDGILSRETLDVARGLTLEISFRLPLTRPDRQSFDLVLARVETLDGSLSSVSEPVSDRVSVGYPLGELERRDETHVHLGIGGIGFPGRIAGPFASGDWNRLALQVRADGETSIWLNGEHVVTGRLHADLTRRDGWRIGLFGRAVDTELWVRDLIVWRGARYGPTE